MMFAPTQLGTLLMALRVVQASLSGVVTDAGTGSPLANAKVVLSDLRREVSTDAAGRYFFAMVPAGPQHVEVRRIGFNYRVLHAIVPAAGSLEINVALRPMPVVLSGVRVQSPVALRGSDPADTGSFPDRGVSHAVIRNHPMHAEADALLALSGGEVLARPESPSGISVRGGATDQTAFLIDGVPVFNPFHAGGSFSAISVDALESARIARGVPPYYHDALSGVVAVVTRRPTGPPQFAGGLSSTHARLTVFGATKDSGATYLISARYGFPGGIAPPDEPSYLRGTDHDLLAKTLLPALGGELSILAYDSRNRFSVASIAGAESAAQSPRNTLSWRSRSAGIGWTGKRGANDVRIMAWRATSGADAHWMSPSAGVQVMQSGRADAGGSLIISRADSLGHLALGAYGRASGTDYEARKLSEGSSSILAIDSRTPALSLFLDAERVLGNWRVGAVASAVHGGGTTRLDPTLSARWAASPGLVLVGSVSRTSQLAQSLRNGDSPVSNIFPAALFAGANARGIPIASSRMALAGAELRLHSGIRSGIQLFLRDFDGLALVAPKTGDPFASAIFTSGSGVAYGVSMDATLAREHYGVIWTYGFQRVTLESGGISYVPEHGTRHFSELGIVLHPDPTLMLRVGATLAAGRTVTASVGGLEWEACNLVDRGCEFAGTPSYEVSALGATRLPIYLRADAGARKHWHVRAGGRDMQLAVYGSITNIFGRRNVLTLARDPATGQDVAVEMRSFAPLVVGMDWRL